LYAKPSILQSLPNKPKRQLKRSLAKSRFYVWDGDISRRMDTTTRDTYALLNAHEQLLEALYIHLGRANLAALGEAQSLVVKQINETGAFPSPSDEIQPQTSAAVESFFLRVRAAL
jgi:hypothetical protein